MYNVRVFDNLIYNTDSHANNIWVTKDWTIVLIDHSRSFRPFPELRAENDLRRFSRSLLAAWRSSIARPSPPRCRSISIATRSTRSWRGAISIVARASAWSRSGAKRPSSSPDRTETHHRQRVSRHMPRRPAAAR